jgi:hypothetical protein
VAASSPRFVATGDFNSDGDLDLAVVNGVAIDNLAIRIGAAGATFGGRPDAV